MVVGRRNFGPSGNDRTTLLVSTGHTESPGALYRLLEPLAQNKVSLTRIESRPSQRRKWDYVFFMDLEGHIEDPPVARALAKRDWIRVLWIEGHTDDRGPAHWNLKLSELRAESVARELIERGVPQDRIKTLFAGEKKPWFCARRAASCSGSE